MKNADISFEQLRSRVDIVDVISKYLTIKKYGDNYKGLCPFHHEKTPSFVVSPQKQIFHCFGCGEGGDVIKFISKIEGLSYPNAGIKLAKDYNIKINFKYQDSLEEYFTTTKLVMEIYHTNLLNNLNIPIIKNFLQNRGISKEIIFKFFIGYAPDSYYFISNELEKRGINLELAEKLGIVKRKSDFYDYFRNRIIFPILNIRGEVIAFGGRTLGEDNPKYLNSPETSVYHKGSNLYGLFENKDDIKRDDKVFIVEGYMDMISLYSHGIKNSVATLGTAFTEQQLKLILRFTNNIVFLYDGDDAGVKAAIRGLITAINSDLNPKAVKLPDKKDPDDFVREMGKEDCIEFISKSYDLVMFLKIIISNSIDLKKIENKIKLMERLKKIFSKIDNPLYKDYFIKGIADILTLDEREVKSSLLKYSQSFTKRGVSITSKEKNLDIEDQITSFLLNNTDYISKVESNFITNRNFLLIFEKLMADINLNDILDDDSFDEQQREHIRELALREHSFESSEEKDKFFKELNHQLKERALKSRFKELTANIKKEERENNQEMIKSLIEEQNRIVEQLKILK